MAKNKNVLYYLLVAVALACCVELHAVEATPSPPMGGMKKELVASIYSSQVGIREKSNSNDGKEVEMYLASVGLKKGNPWCAAFVTWTFKKAGVKTVVSGYSPAWFPKEKVIYHQGVLTKKPPDKTDVFGIWFQNKGRVAHVGFIDQWPQDGSYTITVEGNTNEAGSREGDGVYRKRRIKKQIYVISRWL